MLKIYRIFRWVGYILYEKIFSKFTIKKIIEEAFKNNNKEVLSKLENSDLMLKNYPTNIIPKIKLLNLKVSNPFSTDGIPGEGSFYRSATGSENPPRTLK